MLTQVVIGLPPVSFPWINQRCSAFLIFEIVLSIIGGFLLRAIRAMLTSFLKLLSFMFDLLLIMRAVSFGAITADLSLMLLAFQYIAFSIPLPNFALELFKLFFDFSVDFGSIGVGISVGKITRVRSVRGLKPFKLETGENQLLVV